MCGWGSSLSVWKPKVFQQTHAGGPDPAAAAHDVAVAHDVADDTESSGPRKSDHTANFIDNNAQT